MRRRIIAVTVLFALSLASHALAACAPGGADAADIAAARLAIAAACDCAGAADHGSYVRCARTTAKPLLANASCLQNVMRCARRSTCGKADAVACCRRTARGTVRASIRKNAGACRAPQNGSACVSPSASECDACTATGCAAPTATPAATPTPAPTSPGPTPTPGCGSGVIDGGEDCDGPSCTALLNGVAVQSTCGAPGTLHACECKDSQCGGCLDPAGGEGELCWSSDQCLLQPGGGPMCIIGGCIPTVCESLSDCNFELPLGCENGLCCAPSLPGYFCRIDGMFELPCCGGGTCQGSPGTCCLGPGASCAGGQLCCSGSCTNDSCP